MGEKTDVEEFYRMSDKTENTILILEDDHIMRNYLCKIVTSCDENIVIYDFEDEKMALEFTLNHRVDIFILDIILDEKNSGDRTGISFASIIRDKKEFCSSEIIFVTALGGLEVELLKKVHCFDYIMKPIEKKCVEKVIKGALQKVRGGTADKDEIISFRINGIYFPILTEEIVMLEGHTRLLNVYRKNEVIKVPNISLNAVLKQIHKEKFLEARRKLVVNIRYIENIDPINYYIKVKNRSELIELSRRNKKEFMETYNRFVKVP